MERAVLDGELGGDEAHRACLEGCARAFFAGEEVGVELLDFGAAGDDFTGAEDNFAFGDEEFGDCLRVAFVVGVD